MRGPWLTSVLGAVLLVGIPVEFATGLVSYDAYEPALGNVVNPDRGLFGLYLFTWAATPAWLYRVDEGVHVMLGLALVPVVGAKLWSVIPHLFAWPPWDSAARALERLSLVLLVGGVVFEMTTGILYIDYSGRIDFYTGHFYGAWAFVAGFAVHVAVKLRPMVRALRSRSLVAELRTGLDGTRPEAVDSELVAAAPGPPTISRRGVLALVGGTSLAVVALTAGETVGGGWRRIAVLGTHYRSPGRGANHFPVNYTAAARGITAAQTGPGWRLRVAGDRTVSLARQDLLAMAATTAWLPIACTEGWSTEQRWTGVPLRALAAVVGVDRPGTATLEAMDGHKVVLSGVQASAAESMVALRVNGADLSADHGYPARAVVPSAPGTHDLKWLRAVTFTEGA